MTRCGIAAVLLLGLLAGCATEQAQFVTPEDFARTQVVRAEARTLRAGDEIELAVEVNGSVEIERTSLELGYDGLVPAPLVGDVKLDGLTLPEAREVLISKYDRIFTTQPLITLRMADEKEAGEWGYVTVLGQVRNPGRYAIASSAGMTLSDALHEAGGFGESANMKEVVATRRTETGELVQCQCDITRLGRSGSGQLDLTLFDGDIVQVPERLF